MRLPRVCLLHRLVVFTLALGAVVGARCHAAEPEKDPAARWESTIAGFEAKDKQSPPAPGGVLFIGSSSIRLWDLPKWFPDMATINRGFGGSHMSDSLYFADRIAIPYKPQAIVVYAGDNDLAAGKTPERVLADYQAFVKKIHAALPETRILYIAVKPSIKRWALIDKVRATNSVIQAATAQDERLAFIDIDAPMLGDDGRPRKELFVADGLHMSGAGYAIWSELVKKELAR